MGSSSKRIRSPFVTALVSAVATAVAAPSIGQAVAGNAADPWGTCSEAPLEQPFTRFGDSGQYRLARGGSFEEHIPLWAQLNSKTVEENESFHVHGQEDSRSMTLPPGSHATTEMSCVGRADGTMRLFTRASQTASASKLRVEAVYMDKRGVLRALELGSVAPSKSWAVTPRVRVNVSRRIPHDQLTSVEFRFRPVGPGTWWVDDVYVGER